MDATSNKTEWCYIGKVSHIQFVGKETIFYGRGCHLQFINLESRTISGYTANNSVNGDGIKCYAGHRLLNIFCFAENCGNPNIFVLNYPAFEIISILVGGPIEGYLGLAFSETSALISLGSLPQFTITVWNWRRGEKIGGTSAGLFGREQIIKCNSSSPVRCAQLATGTARLHIWDILMCNKKCTIIHNSVKSPKHASASLVMTEWSVEGILYALDKEGNVYQVNNDNVMEIVISYCNPGNVVPSFTFWRGDLYVTGPSLDIRIYKKNGLLWTQEKSMRPPETLSCLIANKTDILLGISDKTSCIKIDPEENAFEYYTSGDREFTTMCMVYPVGQYVCLLSQSNTINVVEINTGNMVSKHDLMGTALTMAGNPEFPYIGVGYVNGILELISIYDPLNPVPMTSFNLTTNQISSVYFSEYGRVLVAADLKIGEFFILEGLPGCKMKIIAAISTDCRIIDYMLVPSIKCYRLFLIPVTSNEQMKGNKVIRYCITEGNQINIKEYINPNPRRHYYRILSTSKINRDRMFYLIPYGTRCVEEIDTKRGDDMMRVVNSHGTGHQVRKNCCFIDKHHTLTWARDGFIIVKKTDFGPHVGIVLAHHRRDGGVKKAYIDPQGKYVISLGYDKVVACTKFITKEWSDSLQEELLNILNSNRFAMLFERKTIGFETGPESRDHTWLEIEKMRHREQIAKMYEHERTNILNEFNDVKNKLSSLLDENLRGPENEKLSLDEFNLDTKYFDEIKEANRVECRETEQYIKKYISILYTVCENIRNYCFRTMHVQKGTILGIGSNTGVESYTLLPPDGKKIEELKWIQEQIKLERLVNEVDFFEPWKPMDPQYQMEFLNLGPNVPVLKKIKNIEDLEGNSESTTIDNENLIAMAGSSAQNFIEISPDKYNQMECHTFYQLVLLSAMTENDTVRLREYFNKEFENLMQVKTRELDQIREKNQRLRVIVNEINYFSPDKIFVWIIDPEWCQYKNTENMVTIDDKQVPVTPYISPSEQAVLDAKAAEAERIRLLLLADDFKERALMAMMNGVLEVRWEDELKKNVPLPKCMIEKDPEEFNEDDLRAVRDYEEKVKFLNSERERYKKLLNQEYLRITSQIRESVKKFDSRLQNLLLLRIKIDEAIIQEDLILCKERMKLMERLDFDDEEILLKRLIVSENDFIRGLETLINTLQEPLTECRNHNETIQSRDKFLDKNAKKDLSEFNQVVMETSLKLLRRRPKVNFRTISSYNILQALARAVMTKEKVSYLTDDCVEFIDALDSMDQYVGVPQIVDEETYSLICKHRRIKIEHEIKIRSASLELAEAEATVALLQRRLMQKREQAVKTMGKLTQLRIDRLNKMKNIQMQIVLQQGYVEVPMYGNINDFDDAILVSRKEVESINQVILDNGNTKLNTMRHTMTFHREIMMMEWTHKKLRMNIDDLKEELNDINNFKVTKEMQSFLKGRDKTLPFEVELDLLKNSYEIIVAEKKAAHSKMRKLINSLKEDSKNLDLQISDINVDVCECKLEKDWDLDIEAEKLIQDRMISLARRSKMIRKIQENHQTILLSQTELELLRLKTYPTIKYKILT